MRPCALFIELRDGAKGNLIALEMILSIIDRHVFWTWFKGFVLALVVIVSLLVIGDMQSNLSELLDFGVSWKEALFYYGVLIPGFLPAIVPVSLLVSLLLSLGTLHKNLEIVAMRAAGIGLLRITRSLWFSGLVLSGLLFYLNAAVVPWSVETSRTMWNNFYFRDAVKKEQAVEAIGLVYNLTFHHPENGRIWFINRFNEYNYRAYGITISHFDEEGREVNRYLANEGYYSETKRHWILLEGRELTFNPESDDMIRSLAFEEREFESLTEDPDLMQFLKKRPEDLSFWQLRRVRQALAESDDPSVKQYSIRYYSLLVNPLSCFIVVGIAIPFAIGGMRTNPMVGVSKSIGLFLLYYIVLSTSNALGATLVTPWVAAIVPSAAMVLVALYFNLKASKPK